MTPPGGLPKGRKLSSLPAILSSSVTIAIFLLSIAGLLTIRVDVYDESALLMGARLARTGSLPYRDFYTHYGPLAYSLLALVVSGGKNPGLALRFFQAVLLGITIVVLGAMARPGRRGVRGLLVPAGVPFAVLAVAGTFRSSAFLGFFFCFAGLALAALSQASDDVGKARAIAIAGGIALAASALTRPIFAAYAGGSLAIVLLARYAGRPADRRGVSRLLFFFVAAVLSLPALWLLLYPAISPGLALRASVLAPGRLMGGGGRFLSPRFLLSPTGDWLPSAGAIVTGGVFAAASLAWVLSARSGASRRLLLSGALGGVAGTALLVAAIDPARDAVLLTAFLLLLAIAAVYRMRVEIGESPVLASGALFGLASCAFTHYFWSRSDRAHLAPALALAGVAAVLAWPRLERRDRAAVAAVFGVLCLLFPLLPLRAFRAPLRPPWPAATVPSDAAEAVSFADRQSDPHSRFVAVASTHAVTSADPVILFLLSSRRPYTRWYTYDPGVQSSEAVQGEMQQDLERSASRAAVVWHAELYIFEPRLADLSRKTGFDEAFDRLYPVRAARFGQYEVRLRAGAAPPAEETYRPPVRTPPL